MNLRSFFNLVGLRPTPRTYGVDVVAFDLPTDGRVELARWLHPNETPKEVRQDVIDHLRTFLRPGDVAIDIGAHTGDTSVPMALAVGPSGCVLALEPNPYVFPVLERNATLNVGRASIIPMNFAATRESGPIEFEYSDAGFCNGGRHEGVSRWRHAHAFRLSVRGENLEAWLAAHRPDLTARVRYVKVDAEGYDFAVLESIAGLIDHRRPFVRAEVHRLMPEHVRRRLVSFFEERRYRVSIVQGEAHYQGRLTSSRDLPATGQFDLFAEPVS